MSERCPDCGSSETIRYGNRELRGENVQVYKCKSCGRYFSQRGLRHKTYRPKVVLNSISTYNLGHTLEETSKRIAKRFKVRVPTSTIHSWVEEFSEVCTYSKIREEGRELYGPEEVVFRRELRHKQIYDFQYHRAKREIVLNYSQNRKFASLGKYLERAGFGDFPDHIFRIADSESDRRASEMRADLLKVSEDRRTNLAIRLAELGLMLARNNRERHGKVQSFMLANDSRTLACEIPVYLTERDIENLEESDFVFDFKNYRTPITGHIDLLQVRNGFVHILDYKPGAEKVDPQEQLSVYAIALASRTGIPVKCFKCAWFDDKDYFEFFPLKAFYPSN